MEQQAATQGSLKTINSGATLGVLSKQADPKRVSTDPFLRSMSYWFLKDYKQALNTLFEVDINSKKSSSSSSIAIISHVFNFYSFLKRHPLVIKQQQVELCSEETTTDVLDRVGPIERRLHFVTAYYHLINGCPLLALDVLSKLPKYIYPTSKSSSSSNRKPSGNLGIYR